MVDDVLLNQRKGNRMTKHCGRIDEEPACDVWFCMVWFAGFIFILLRRQTLEPCP